MKDRIKSYSFWTALAGAAVVLCQALGKCFGFSISDEIVTGVVMAIAGLLVVLGVVTMPNSADGTTQEDIQSQGEQSEEEQNRIKSQEDKKEDEGE